MYLGYVHLAFEVRFLKSDSRIVISLMFQTNRKAFVPFRNYSNGNDDNKKYRNNIITITTTFPAVVDFSTHNFHDDQKENTDSGHTNNGDDNNFIIDERIMMKLL